jgi:hypothetical protein
MVFGFFNESRGAKSKKRGAKTALLLSRWKARILTVR